ncbi:hypothetical protein [Aeromonas jandaei]|uniref:hypothetical protein n=1 Tax=Aeromonas jandaei TaxID=650 RepID=UPI003B9EBFA9
MMMKGNLMYSIKKYVSAQEKITNEEFYVAQHYQRQKYLPSGSGHALAPTNKILMPGTCLGLTLSWLKKVFVSGGIEHFPPSKDRLGVSEGMLLQYLYILGHNTSDLYNELYNGGSIDVEAQREDAEQNHILAMSVENLEEELRCENIALKETLEWLGWRVINNESISSFNLLEKLNNIEWDDCCYLYLVGLADHCAGIAICNGLLSFYDPNKGLFTYSKDEAIDNVKLLFMLNDYIKGYASSKLMLTEVKY